MALCLAACGNPDDSADERDNVGLQELVVGAATDTLRVATLNMSVGWRAESLVLNKLSDTAVVYSAVQTLYSQFEASQPSERIRVMARAIVDHPVDVLALQEVQVMRLNAAPAFHFLDTLLTVLDSLEGGRQWQVVRQQINRVDANVANAEGTRLDIEFWEGQATLVRNALEVLESDSAVFSKLVSFSILSEKFDSERGYVRTTVRKPNGAIWQLYNTHLEVELLSLFNAPQGMELNSVVWDDWQNLAKGAQVVLGDLNAYNGKAGLGALTSAGSGLLDAWSVAYGGETAAAYTCCVTNLNDPLTGGYDRRLDYILVRNVRKVENVQSLSLRGTRVWGGDHALVRAELIQQL